MAVAVSKLYKQLKANGSIVNDDVTTKKPLIPNVYHFIRWVRM